MALGIVLMIGVSVLTIVLEYWAKTDRGRMNVQFPMVFLWACSLVIFLLGFAGKMLGALFTPWV